MQLSLRLRNFAGEGVETGHSLQSSSAVTTTALGELPAVAKRALQTAALARAFAEGTAEIGSPGAIARGTHSGCRRDWSARSWGWRGCLATAPATGALAEHQAVAKRTFKRSVFSGALAKRTHKPRSTRAAASTTTRCMGGQRQRTKGKQKRQAH